MIPNSNKKQRGSRNGNNGDYYNPQVLINAGLIVLPDDVVLDTDNFDDVVLTYCSKEEPVPVHGYDKDNDRRLDKIVGRRLWAIQEADPFQVVVAQPNLPKMVYNQTKFRLKNLRGYYSKKYRQHYYKADTLELVDDGAGGQ